jgi:hypothetical protein
MWIRKTEEELKKEDRLLCTAAFIILFIVLIVRLFKSDHSLFEVILQFGLVVLATIFLTPWRWSIFTSMRGVAWPRQVVCDKCGKEKDSRDGQRYCSCGGTYWEIQYMKWIKEPLKEEDKKASSECLNCGVMISQEQNKCEKCGWSWK